MHVRYITKVGVVLAPVLSVFGLLWGFAAMGWGGFFDGVCRLLHEQGTTRV